MKQLLLVATVGTCIALCGCSGNGRYTSVVDDSGGVIVTDTRTGDVRVVLLEKRKVWTWKNGESKAVMETWELIDRTK